MTSKGLNFGDRLVALWCIIDFLTHAVLETSFVVLSITGTVASSTSWWSLVWKEYGKADSRWLYSDSCVVAVELLTCTLDSLLCLFLLYAIIKRKPYRHFVQIVLCVCELYGDWMTFAPEWLTGNKSLNTSNPMYLWVYLAFSNGVWVVIPALLLAQSFFASKRAFAAAKTNAKTKKQ
eukprot:GEZU01016418.1.p1 GENE.GEZU01016418.1~~GEZU01016418.1.p1  ORF type:complete len:178 (+),score=29.82 GEZU01016418.1:106-639(+)